MKQEIEKKVGKVWLLGAGPSDLSLFTLKGKRLLETADVVVYDKLVGQGILSLIPRDTTLIDVGKTAGKHPVPQEKINEILLSEALQGKKVVRLKGGDPFVFGRGGEELELLVSHNIPFEVVPGVTSAISVPAYNGIPVTHRDFCSSLHIITGHTQKNPEADVDYEALVRLSGTLIFLMGVGALPVICQGLLSAGMAEDMPAAILERGTTAHQRRVVSTLVNLPREAEKAAIKTPAVIVVGKVCSLADQFHWAEDRKLGGIKVAVTRPRDRGSKLREMLSDLGAEVVSLPTILTREIPDNHEFLEVLQRIENYSWLAFTSPAGVKVFYDTMKREHLDIRRLSGVRLAAIGTGTQKALEETGVFVEVVPSVYSGEALGRALAEVIQKEGKKSNVLLLRAKLGTEAVTEPLLEAGISFTDVPIYETLEENPRETEIYDETVDYICFTSASTVRAFVKTYPLTCFEKVRAVCIGEQTAAVAKAYQMECFISKEATLEGIVECLISQVEPEKKRRTL